MLAPRDKINSNDQGFVPVERKADPPPSNKANRFVWGFGIVMVIIAGGGFTMKFIEFATVLMSDEPMQFAFLPVVTYLMVAAGFACLFFWAYLKGQFKDIESAKYRMLQMQDEIDRTGDIRPAAGGQRSEVSTQN